ncbi:uncharacterized protein LOC142419922 [Mycteria americana]|uniref:uncharacterized protein LOC142419922 n=1 Tax=Mycteria americana TaxID=33587 RepID=UPI003F58C41A
MSLQAASSAVWKRRVSGKRAPRHRGAGPGRGGSVGAGRGVGAAAARGRAGGAGRSGPDRGCARLLCGCRRALVPRPAPARQGMMAPGLGPWLLALSLAAGPAAVTGQVALEQHIGELAVREGDGVTFQCSMSGDSMSSYYMFWYRQRPRGTLDWIYREGDAYGEGFQDRFKGTVESSQNRFTLQIQAAKQGDEAVYYCGAGLTLEQLCSRVDQKPTAREYRL